MSRWFLVSRKDSVASSMLLTTTLGAGKHQIVTRGRSTDTIDKVLRLSASFTLALNEVVVSNSRLLYGDLSRVNSEGQAVMLRLYLPKAPLESPIRHWLLHNIRGCESFWLIFIRSMVVIRQKHCQWGFVGQFVYSFRDCRNVSDNCFSGCWKTLCAIFQSKQSERPPKFKGKLARPC